MISGLEFDKKARKKSTLAFITNTLSNLVILIFIRGMMHYNNKLLFFCILTIAVWSKPFVFAQTEQDMMLLLGAYEGDTIKVAEAMQLGADVNAISVDGVTPLMYAVQEANIPMLILLLDAGALPDKKGPGVPPAIFTAAEAGYEGIVGILLSAGADPDISDNLGQSALMIACKYNDFRIAWMLLEGGANPNLLDAGGNSALQFAASHSAYECASLLLNRRTIAHIKNEYGNTALMKAARINDLALGELILGYDSLIFNRNHLGMSTPDIAIIHQNEAFIRLLLDKYTHASIDTANRLSTKDRSHILKDQDQWKTSARLALKTGNNSTYRLIKRSTGFGYSKPVISKVNFGFMALFNQKTHMVGGYWGIKESHSGIDVGLAWLTRFKPDRLLLEIDGQTYQFREKRDAILFHAKKNVKLHERNDWKSLLQASAMGGYSWGTYRGTHYKPEDIWLWSAGLSYAWEWRYFNGSLGYSYFPLPGEQSYHMAEISLGFQINTINHKKYGNVL